MSYCGACGGYAPGCPFPGQGRCAPAPNPHDEKTARLLATAVLLNAKVAGMVSANHAMLSRMMQPPYGKQHFDEIAAQLEKEIAT